MLKYRKYINLKKVMLWEQFVALSVKNAKSKNLDARSVTTQVC